MDEARTLIAIEGPEGAGKSTIVARLKLAPYSTSIDFIDEAASWVGRHYPLGSDANFMSELALLTANGIAFEKMRQALLNGRPVISDRAWPSQVVYGRVRQRITPQYAFPHELFALQERVLFQLYEDIIPHLAFVYVEVPADEALLRLHQRFDTERIFKPPSTFWLEAAYSEYERYFTTLDVIPVHRIDGSGTQEEVFDRFVRAAKQLGLCGVV